MGQSFLSFIGKSLFSLPYDSHRMLDKLVCDRTHTVRCPLIPLHSILITLDFPLFHTVAPLPNAEPQSAPNS